VVPLKGRRPIFPGSVKSTAISPRKGVIGDYKNYFSEKDLELFDKIAGVLMKDLGYYQ